MLFRTPDGRYEPCPFLIQTQKVDSVPFVLAEIAETEYSQILKANKKKIIQLTWEAFPNSPWAKSFLESTHHGPDHGQIVIGRASLLREQLTPEEESSFQVEARAIDPYSPEEAAMTVIKIAAFFHDCGRYADDGSVAKNQFDHPKRSAKRATEFCKRHKLDHLLQMVNEAILYHDFQDEVFTPHYGPAPTTTIGKIIQAADQLDWVSPGGILRPLFFTEERLIKRRQKLFENIIQAYNDNPINRKTLRNICEANPLLNKEELRRAIEDPYTTFSEIHDIIFDTYVVQEQLFLEMFKNDPHISLEERYFWTKGYPPDTLSVYCRLCFGTSGPQRFGTEYSRHLENLWRTTLETHIKTMIITNSHPVTGENIFNPDHIEEILQIFQAYKLEWQKRNSKARQ